MKIHAKLLSSIINNLETIRDNTFDENNIKLLLSEIRDCGLNKNGFLKETCHFLAHPVARDQGICHSSVDVCYLKLKYANIQPHTPITFNLEKIPRNEFQTLLDAISKSNKKLFCDYKIENKRASRDSVTKFFKESYKKKESVYEISKPDNLELIEVLLNLIFRVIEVNVVFNQHDLLNELKKVLKAILKSNRIKDDYTESINCNKNKIMLCILSLLQEAKFSLYDNSEAQSVITCININSAVNDNETPKELTYYCDFNVPYMDKSFRVPIIQTDIGYAEYFCLDDLTNLKTIPLFQVTRNSAGELGVELIELSTTEDS